VCALARTTSGVYGSYKTYLRVWGIRRLVELEAAIRGKDPGTIVTRTPVEVAEAVGEAEVRAQAAQRAAGGPYAAARASPPSPGRDRRPAGRVGGREA
jgi:hypothetical protein